MEYQAPEKKSSVNWDRYLRTSQVAKRLDLTPSRIAQLRDDGELPAERTALGFLYRLEDVERLARERARRGLIKAEQ